MGEIKKPFFFLTSFFLNPKKEGFWFSRYILVYIYIHTYYTYTHYTISIFHHLQTRPEKLRCWFVYQCISMYIWCLFHDTSNIPFFHPAPPALPALPGLLARCRHRALAPIVRTVPGSSPSWTTRRVAWLSSWSSQVTRICVEFGGRWPWTYHDIPAILRWKPGKPGFWYIAKSRCNQSAKCWK